MTNGAVTQVSQTTFSRIKGLSEIRRLPRLGKIRLGIKAISQRGVEHPKEVPYFVVPPEVAKVYGEKPLKLDIMFPIEDELMVFPQSYKWYVSQGLRCKGNGMTAKRRMADLANGNRVPLNGEELPKDPNALVEVACPCPLLESGDCRQNANLMVLLPKVSLGGVYQITTGSFHNIVRINSCIDYVRGLVGHISMVPLSLTRQEEEIQYEGKKAKHYLLQVVLNVNLMEVAQLRENTRMILAQTVRLVLPAPVEDGPEPTGPAPVEQVIETTAVPEPPSPPPQAPSPAGNGKSRFEDWLILLSEVPTVAEVEKLWSQLTAKGTGLWWSLKGEQQSKLIMTKDKRKTALQARAKAEAK